MKKLVLLFAALLVAGCGEKSLSESKIKKLLGKAIDAESLQERNDLMYKVNESNPYSGWVKMMYDSGQVAGLAKLKDGKPDGPYAAWHENGQKASELIYRDGRPVDGHYTSWYENGQKSFERTYKERVYDGLITKWYENGQKAEELVYRNGEVVDGLWKEWHENGKVLLEKNYVGGEEVSVKYGNSKGEEVESIAHALTTEKMMERIARSMGELFSD